MSIDERVVEPPIVKDCMSGDRKLFDAGYCILSSYAWCKHQFKDDEKPLFGCKLYGVDNGK